MGLLSNGQPLSFDETNRHAEHVREHGIKQFINIYNKNYDRNDRCFKWGDELEYMIVKFDHKSKKVRLSLRARELLEPLEKKAEAQEELQVLWRPEFGAYMLEGIPGHPYGHISPNLFNRVEENMNCRRRQIRQLLYADEALICMTNFPRLGSVDCTHPYTKPDPLNSINKSIYCADECTFTGHPRYMTGGLNSRLRKGGKVVANIPIFRDIETVDPFMETFDDPEYNQLAEPDHIYLDAIMMGMGCACLQVTFQASNLNEGLFLYDQMATLCPIMMALSASTPVVKGYLSDLDCRWSILSQALDDRTAEELGERPLNTSKYRIQKSRYDSIDCYLCDFNHKYNDIDFAYNQGYYDEMVSGGIPNGLAKHIAHLFIRDPTVIYREQLHLNDEIDSDNFESINSTVWQTMRLKPPQMSDPSLGWRVEFRPMDIQSTDFENTAYAVIVVLISRVILAFDLNLMIPISKVDENIIEAQKRDAVNTGRFWVSKDIFGKSTCAKKSGDNEKQYVLMSINEIMNGKNRVFPGLLPLIREYLKTIGLDMETRNKLEDYIQLIANRASGKSQTTAQWIRDFVHKHCDYKSDSVVNDVITYDLIMALNRLQNNSQEFIDK